MEQSRGDPYTAVPDLHGHGRIGRMLFSSLPTRTTTTLWCRCPSTTLWCPSSLVPTTLYSTTLCPVGRVGRHVCLGGRELMDLAGAFLHRLLLLLQHVLRRAGRLAEAPRPLAVPRGTLSGQPGPADRQCHMETPVPPKPPWFTPLALVRPEKDMVEKRSGHNTARLRCLGYVRTPV